MGNFFRSKVFKGTLFLTIFGFLGKALGAVFKIGLTSLIGSFGMGLYQLIFPLLVFFIVLSSEGFSLALTVKTAEDKTGTKHNGYFKLAFIYTLVLSLLSAGIIIIFSGLLGKLQGERMDSFLYVVVAVGVVVISLLSVFKAKIRGEERFKLYSVAEIIEDLFKVVFGLILGYLLLDYGVSVAVAGVIAGIVLSSLVTIIFLLCFKGKTKGYKIHSLPLNPLEKKNYLKFSLISLGAALVIPAIQFIESAIIIGLLTKSGATSLVATKLYGLSRGSVAALINLPFCLLASFEVLLLPNLARAKNGGIYYKKTELSLFLSIFVSLPFVLLFVLFAPIVMEIVYGGSFTATELQIGANLLRLGSVGIIFSSISTILSVILNSNNIAVAPFVASVIAGVAKIIFLIIFVPRISIYGAELASVLFSMATCLINLIFAIKNKIFTKPKNVMITSLLWLIVFGFVWLLYLLFLRVFESMVIACICAILSTGLALLVLGLIVYFIFKDKLIFGLKKMFKLE